MTEPVAVEETPADPPSANAPVLAALVCGNPRCPNKGQHVQIHEDTVLPVHCGGCFGVLHCSHDPGDPQIHGGNLEDPVQHTVTRCRNCRTELAHDTRELTPAELIEAAPPGIAAVLRHLAGQ